MMTSPPSQDDALPLDAAPSLQPSRHKMMLPNVTIAHPKILIVDDEPTTVRVFRKYLSDAEYGNILSTSDAAQALETIRRESPDVILLDIVMPGMSGLDILAAVRGDSAREHTPVIILTASTDSDAKLRALELGATDFLQKPVDPTELIPRVRNAIHIKAFYDYYMEYVAASGCSAADQSPTAAGAEPGARGDDERCLAEVMDRPSMKLKWPVLRQTCFPEVRARAKVLVVDDEPINIKLIRKCLTTEGYEKIVSTSQATEAISLVQREMPDIILLDIMMPGLSGLEILRRLRAEEALAGIPVVILTASTDAATKQQAFDLGATEFLTKPIEPVELLPRVKNALLVKSHQDHMQEYAGALEQEIAGQVKSIEKYAVALETANEMLRRSREAAQIADRAKSRFLANMSHEIRTPLTSIIGFGEEMLDELQTTPRCEGLLPHVETMVKNGRHLLEVVNDILDLSKIEAGGFTIEVRRYSPLEICSEVVNSLQMQAERKGLCLALQCSGPVPETIPTDAVCLRRILLNLLGNAIKFTETGSVRLAVGLLHEQAEPVLEFRVIDTGVGIQADALPRLFRPFVQADASVARRYGGTGLGLTVSRYLAEKLNGTITVESEVGRGSTFCLRLPTGCLEGVGVLDAPVAAASHLGQATGKVSSPPNLPNLHYRILLAEDSVDNQRLLSLILGKAGAQVEVADNGQIACEKAVAAARSGKPFDVILMDMEMPVLDGYSAARRLREGGYSYPIIALTAHAMAGERQNCLDAGCDDYATKPINRDNLLHTIGRYASRNAHAVDTSLT
jgi:CheY-like chemotaxis protein